MKSLDCYVLLSKGEGFSIAPREALALGIPCIITNNTAHKTICNTGFVCNVKCNKKINAYYPWFGNVGYQFDCSVDQVCRCLKLMYQNYSNYKVKALKARDWVKSYSYKNLRAKFLEIISDIKNTDAG